MSRSINFKVPNTIQKNVGGTRFWVSRLGADDLKMSEVSISMLGWFWGPRDNHRRYWDNFGCVKKVSCHILRILKRGESYGESSDSVTAGNNTIQILKEKQAIFLIFWFSNIWVDSPFDSPFITFVKIEFVSSYKYQESKINFIRWVDPEKVTFKVPSMFFWKKVGGHSISRLEMWTRWLQNGWNIDVRARLKP